MSIEFKKGEKKIRVNITVDRALLDKAKGRLSLFGGKLSTLFNAYLSDFVSSMDKQYDENAKAMEEKIKELEYRVKKLERH